MSLNTKQLRKNRQSPKRLKDELMKISRRCAKLPDKDTRSPEEIIGYNQYGICH